MRKTCINMVHELAEKDKKVVFVGSDLSPGLLSKMKEQFGNRHYMEGIAEANVIGMAAGMAMEGFKPYVNTIATFITRRCYEQVAVDLCLHNLPVRLIGNGGGYVYAPLGPTHQAIEDIAIMRALPNMTVTAVCDADEMERLMKATLDWPNPIYIRLGKGGDPIISRDELGFKIGKAINLHPSKNEESDVLIISTGVATTQALEAAKQLEKVGVDVNLLHIHTIKPLDEEAILTATKNTRKIITVEEHSLIGGLGSAVIELLIDKFEGKLPSIKRLGISDKFSEHYGSQLELMKHVGIAAQNIVDAVLKDKKRKAA